MDSLLEPPATIGVYSDKSGCHIREPGDHPGSGQLAKKMDYNEDNRMLTMTRKNRKMTRRYRVEQLETRQLLSALVQTDAVDYAPNTVAHFTALNDGTPGPNFQAGETINFHVSRTDGIPISSPPAVQDWSVTNSPDGSVVTDWNVDSQFADASLSVTATGATSGATSTAFFTDGYPAAISVTPVDGTAQTYGVAGNAAYNVKVTDNSDGNPLSAWLSTPSLPAGLTATWSANSASPGRFQNFGGGHYGLQFDAGEKGVSGYATLTLTTTAADSAGNYPFQVEVAKNTDPTHGAMTANNALTINHAPVVLTVSDAGGVYKGSPYTATATVNGGSSLEGVTPWLDYRTSDGMVDLGTQAPTNVGSYRVLAQFDGSANYASADSSYVYFSITQASDTLTVSDDGGTYKGSQYAATATINGGSSLDGVPVTFDYHQYNGGLWNDIGATAPTNVGYYYATATYAGSANHVANTTSTNGFNIVAKTVTGDFTVANKVYDGGTSATVTGVTLTGVINADDVHMVLGSVAFTSANAGIETAHTSTRPVLSGTKANNYWPMGWTSNVNATIEQAPLSIQAHWSTKTYDGTTNVTDGAKPTIIDGSLVGSDTISNLTESFVSSNADRFIVTQVDSGFVVNDGNGGNNYAILVYGGLGTISKAPLTITAAYSTKTYDATTNVTDGATPTVTGLVPGDTVTNLTESFYSPPDVGSGVTQVNPGYSINDNNGGNNYQVTIQQGSGVITPASLTITAGSSSKTYDGTTNVVDGASPTFQGLRITIANSG